MNKKVNAILSITGDKPVEVLDDELHALIGQGILTFKNAVKALKDAGIKLDTRFYPWLKELIDPKSGEVNEVAPEPPAESSPVVDEGDLNYDLRKSKVEGPPEDVPASADGA